jgi:large repetitive protein
VVDYTYTVENTGNVPLTASKAGNGTVTAQNCSPVTYVSGDTNANGLIDVDETWSFTCTTGPVGTSQVFQNVTATTSDIVFAYEVTDTETVAINVIDPSIEIAKVAADSVLPAGPGADISVGTTNNITYTYTVTNTGDVDLENITPFDDKCSPLVGPSGDIGLDGVLSVGEVWTYTCAAGLLTSTTVNRAVVTATYDEPGLSGSVSSDQVEATVRVLKPELLILKSIETPYVRIGTDVTYTFSVRNTGETTFTQAGLGTPRDTKDSVDPPPPAPPAPTACEPIDGPYLDAAGTIDATGDLTPGVTWYYTCTTEITEDVLNFFTFPDAEDELGTSYTPVPGVEQVFALDPDFTITKVALSWIDGPGDDILGMKDTPITYTVSITGSAGTSTSGASLNSIDLTDVSDPFCDTPLDYVSGDTDEDGLLTPGETWVFSCQLDELLAGPPTVNTVSATGRIAARTLDDQGDPVSPTDGLDDITKTAEATVTPARPELTLTKSALPDPVTAAGQTVTYTFEIENTGDVTVTNILLTDSLTGSGLSAIVCVPNTPDGVFVSVPGSLLPGESVECTATRDVTQADMDAGSIINTASVTGLDPDNKPVEDQDTVTVQADQDPQLDVGEVGCVG